MALKTYFKKKKKKKILGAHLSVAEATLAKYT